jgi:hypothetical protein
MRRFILSRVLFGILTVPLVSTRRSGRGDDRNPDRRDGDTQGVSPPSADTPASSPPLRLSRPNSFGEGRGFITCAVTGAGDTPARSPRVPVTPMSPTCRYSSGLGRSRAPVTRRVQGTTSSPLTLCCRNRTNRGTLIYQTVELDISASTDEGVGACLRDGETDRDRSLGDTKSAQGEGYKVDA